MSSDYAVYRATLDDQVRVAEFIRHHFMPDMPLVRAFGLENDPPIRPLPQQDPSATCEDFVIKAVNDRGEIVGLASNKVDIIFNVDSSTPPKVKQMVEFLKLIEELANLKSLPERTIELRVLSVHKDWRHRGMATRLVKESVKEARDAGFKTMKMCCTNEFTAKVARSLGWREFYRLAYKDYPTVSGREVSLIPTPPHEYLYYYVTDL